VKKEGKRKGGRKKKTRDKRAWLPFPDRRNLLVEYEEEMGQVNYHPRKQNRK